MVSRFPHRAYFSDSASIANSPRRSHVAAYGTVGESAAGLRNTRHLVIGAGQVGKALNDVLSAQKYPVRMIDRTTLDLSEPEKLSQVLSSEEFDAVWLTAAETRVDWCEANREHTFNVNAVAPGKIADICRGRGLKLVHFSTDYVFSGIENGGLREHPYLETDAPAPLQVYGESKLESERRVLNEHPEATVVRTSAVFAGGGRNFFSAILDRSKLGEKISVVDDQVVSPTFALHLAIWLASRFPYLPAGVIHLAGQGEASWFRLAQTAYELLGLDPREIKPAKSGDTGRPTKRPAYSALASTVLPARALPGLPPWLEGLSAWAAGEKQVR